MDELREALETAVMDVLDGSPAGPLFASRVKRVCTEVLQRRKLQGTVEVWDGGRHVRVKIRKGDRVEQIVVGLDVM